MLLTGFSDVIGSWKIIAILRAADLAAARALRARAGSPCPSSLHRPGRIGRAVDQPHHGQARDALAGAGLADDAERLAFLDREADAVDRLDDAVVRPERRPEIRDLEDGCHASLIRGSRTAYRRSTIRLKTMTASVEKTTTPRITGRSFWLYAWITRSPEAAEREDRLGEDRPAERQPDVHAEDRHDRQHAVAQDVVPHAPDAQPAPLARAVRT